VISIRNVHKRFGAQVVLNGIDLDIPLGKTTTIVGPSGVGKSVLLKLIMGILDPDLGNIEIFGRSITQATSESERNEIRSSLGVLFQSAALFDSLTVYENVAFPLVERGGFSRKDIHRNVIFMLESLSLLPYASNFPEEISMGMRKRVGMARSLITEPKILLFDEPNTGLDPLVGQEVYDLIKVCKEKWGFTGIVISHEIPEVFQVSDRVVMLLNGNIIEEGPPEVLINSSNLAVKQFLLGSVDGPIKIQ
jgi:phospholipid/cholesterol/gamma-HCH transport system ATP-binding protein